MLLSWKETPIELSVFPSVCIKEDESHMAKNRYSADYRLIETFDEKGRVRTGYEYIGASYVFENGAEAARRPARTLPFLMLAGWLCYFAAMARYSSAMRRLYAALPMAFCAVPLTLLTGYALTLFSLKEPLEHRRADMLNNRFPAAALLLMVFSGFALLGGLAAQLAGEVYLAGDGLYFAGAAGLLLTALRCFTWRVRIRAKEQS